MNWLRLLPALTLTVIATSTQATLNWAPLPRQSPHVHLSVVVNPWPVYYPPSSYRPAFYPPVVIQAPAPTIYLEPAPAAIPYWYYCDALQAYYPYVQQCPGGWRRVPAQPPPQ
ncbi:MAG: hypothetical protein JSR19_12235 [Proteobacteria bacterium]|nr:hypothetical protein [Pseudomonadota bacterium]HQR03329.1 hypothetical protein [Rhodocyclaceae bacterium]